MLQAFIVRVRRLGVEPSSITEPNPCEISLSVSDFCLAFFVFVFYITTLHTSNSHNIPDVFVIFTYVIIYHSHLVCSLTVNAPYFETKQIHTKNPVYGFVYHVANYFGEQESLIYTPYNQIATPSQKAIRHNKSYMDFVQSNNDFEDIDLLFDSSDLTDLSNDLFDFEQEKAQIEYHKAAKPTVVNKSGGRAAPKQKANDYLDNYVSKSKCGGSSKSNHTKKDHRKNNTIAKVAHAPTAPTQEDSKLLDLHISKHQNIGDDWKTQPHQEYAGLVFEDHQYAGVILNAALRNLHWEEVCHFIKNITISEPKVSTDAEKLAVVETTRMLGTCLHYNIQDMCESQAEAYRVALVHVFSNVKELETNYKFEHVESQHKHHKFENNPEICLAPIPKRCFESKKTRNNFIPPLFRYNCDVTQHNFWYEVIEHMHATAKMLTKTKLSNLLRQEVKENNGINIVTILMHKCYVWSEKSYPLKPSDYMKMSWMVPFIPTNYYLYEVCVDNPKGKTIYTQYLRFFQFFRQMAIQLRDSVIRYAKHYLEVSGLPSYQREEYRLTLKNSFKSIMQQPPAQMMFMRGATKQEVTDMIYQNYFGKIKTAVLKTDAIKSNKANKRVKLVKGRLMDRQAKAELQDFDCSLDVIRDSCQSLEFDDPPKEKSYLQHIWDLIKVSTAICSVWSLITWTLDGTLFKLYQYVSDNVSDFFKFSKILRPIRKSYTYVSRIIDETSLFFTDSTATISDETTILFVELNATVHIIYNVITGNIPQAFTHASYFAFTRAKLVKEVIMSIPGLRSTKIPVTFVWNAGGEILNLTLEEFDELNEIKKRRSITEHDSFRARMIRKRRDKTQALANDDFSVWLKPFAKLLSTVTQGDMSERDVRDANAMYQYLNHRTNFIADQANLFKNIISFLGMFIFGFDPFDPTYHKFAADLYATMDFVEANMKYKASLSTNKPLMEEILKREPIAIACGRDPKMSLLPSFLRSYFTKRLDQLETLCKLSHAFLRGTHARDTPVFVLVTGPPGVGKTTTFNLVHDMLCTILKYPKGPEGIYVFNPSNEFHEGYAHQMFVQMDDMFKNNDVKVREVEATNIINMVNTSAYNMPMAFESKGAVFFDSDFIIGTTNLCNAGFEKCTWQIGLTDHEAFLRRAQIILHRDERLDNVDAPHLISFRVDKCDLFPDNVGKHLTAAEISILMLDIRLSNHEFSKKLIYTEDDIKEHFPEFDAMFDKYKLPTDVARTHNPNDAVQSGTSTFNKHLLDFEMEDLIMPQDFQQARDVTHIEDDVDVTTVENLLPDPLGLDPDYQPMSATDYLRRTLQAKFGDEDVEDPAVIKRIRFYSLLFFLLIAITTATSVWYFWRKDESQSFQGKMGKRANRRYKNTMESKTRTVKPMNVGSRTSTQSNESNYMKCLINNVSKGIVLFYGRAIDPVTKKSVPGSGSQAEGFHYEDGVFFVPAHFIKKYDDYTSCLIQIRMQWTNGSITVDDPLCYEVEGEDCAFFRVESIPTLPPSLRKYVWLDDDVADIVEGTPMHLLSVTGDRQANIKPITKGRALSPTSYVDMRENIFKVNFCINYYEHTTEGDSGSVVTIASQQGSVKIVGFHVCRRFTSTSDYGFALAFTQDCLDSLLVQAGMRVDSVQSADMTIPFDALYKTEPSMCHFPPTRSKLRESLMFGWRGPAECIPAHLTVFRNSEGELINPLLLAMKKLRTVHTVETCFDRQNVIDYLMMLYPQIADRRLLTLEEALSGIPGTEIRSVNAGTSAGYPWNHAHKKGKTAYIIIKGCEYSYEPEFRSQLVQFIEKLKNGEQIVVIWCVTLKDETRPYLKVEAGKTRLFTACPVHYLIIMRVYFGTFIGYLKSLAGVKPVCVGINAHSIEWSDMYLRLNRFGKSIVAGDFENWDGSIPKFIALIVVDFINKWYDDGPTNKRVRELLCEHLYEAVLVCYDTVFQTKGSGPTGNPITSEWNSLIQIAMNYIVLTEDFHLDETQFEMSVYGDDNILAADVPNLRCSDFAPHYERRFNVKYTHWSKLEHEAYDTMNTINFIGRSFVKDAMGIYRAPLPLVTICEAFYWVRGDNSDEIQMLSVADTFFLELSHHPREIFELVSKECLLAVRQNIPRLYDAILSRKLLYGTYYNRMYHAGNSKTEFKTESKDIKFHEGTFIPVETRNTEFTDRAVNEPVPTLVDELGTFNDVAPVTEGVINAEGGQKPYKASNMETFNFNDFLNREYNVVDVPNPVVFVPWLTSQAAGSLLSLISFPQAIFQQPPIADKLNDFRLFSADAIRYSVRTTASRVLFGKCMIIFFPFAEYYPVDSSTLAVQTLPTNIYQLSGHPHMLFDASSSDVVTFEVPFVSPFRAIDLGKYGNGEMGKFAIYVMNPLTNTDNATASAQLTITASFVNARVWMPTDTSTGYTSIRERLLDRPGSVASKVRLAAEFDTVQSREGAVAKVQMHKAMLSKNMEGARKLTSTDATKTVTSTLNSAIKTVKLVGSTMANVAIGAAENALMLAMLGLSKPTTMNVSTMVTQNPNFNINNGNGIDTLPKIAVDNENAISTAPNVGGITADEMSITYIASTPSLVSIVAFLPASYPIAICSTGIDANLTFVDHIRLQYWYWYGSIKVKSYITASIFQSVRLVFFLAVDSTSDWRVCYHKIVEVQGSTEVEMTLPYCSQQVAATSTTNVTPYSLFVAVLAWSQNDASLSNPIYINTYKAAGSDFRVCAPKDVYYHVQSCPRMDFNDDFEPIHPSIEGYAQDHLICGEEILTLRQMAHKFSPNFAFTGPYNETLLNPSTASGTILLGRDMYGLFYRFWRGSLRNKYMSLQANTKYISHMVCNQAGTAFHGMFVTGPNLNSSEGEIPYYSPCLFEATTGQQLAQRYVTNNSTQHVFEMTAVGDDFSFHWLILPVAGYYVNCSVLYGYAGLDQFYE
jgi:hypothetical protein